MQYKVLYKQQNNNQKHIKHLTNNYLKNTNKLTVFQKKMYFNCFFVHFLAQH